MTGGISDNEPLLPQAGAGPGPGRGPGPGIGPAGIIGLIPVTTAHRFVLMNFLCNRIFTWGWAYKKKVFFRRLKIQSI